MNGYDPKNPKHRTMVIQDRVAKIMREQRVSYDEAWVTANADTDMQPFVAAMEESGSNKQNVAGAILQSLHKQMVDMGLIAAEKTIAATHLSSTKSAILASPLFQPLLAFQAAHSTANAAAWFQANQADATLESLSVNIAAQIVKATIQGAVDCLANYITQANACAEVYASPLFAPLVDYVKKLTGEDMRTGNSAVIMQHALKYFIQGAINRIGLPALEKEIASSPETAQFAQFLKGTKTINNLAPAVDISNPRARSEALQALVRKRMGEKNESYDDAFAACMKDPANGGLVGAMGYGA